MRRSTILSGLSLTAKILMQRIIPPRVAYFAEKIGVSDYVGALSVGEHTIGIVSTNGTATTTFTVNAKAAVTDNDTVSPQAEDNSHMTLWIVLLFVGVVLLIVIGICIKKKNHNR